MWAQIQSLRRSVWTLAFTVVSAVGNCLVISVTAYNCCGHKSLFHVPGNGCNDNHPDSRQNRPVYLEAAVFQRVSIELE